MAPVQHTDYHPQTIHNNALERLVRELLLVGDRSVISQIAAAWLRAPGLAAYVKKEVNTEYIEGDVSRSAKSNLVKNLA